MILTGHEGSAVGMAKNYPHTFYDDPDIFINDYIGADCLELCREIVGDLPPGRFASTARRLRQAEYRQQQEHIQSFQNHPQWGTPKYRSVFPRRKEAYRAFANAETQEEVKAAVDLIRQVIKDS